jgi:phosphatidate cytidylyltransferase
MNNLAKRFFSSLIGLPVIILSIVYSDWSYFFLFLLIAIATTYEYMSLLKKKGIILTNVGVLIGGILLYCGSFLYVKGFINIGIMPLLYFSFLGIYFIVLYQSSNQNPFETIAYSLSCLIYVVFPFCSLHFATFINKVYNYEIIIGFLLILWTSDIAAFFGGKLLGKRKLLVRVSPQKTWEGVISGTICCLIVGVVLSNYFTVFSSNQWLIIAFCISIISVYGDLLESLLKRSLNIKDSGSLIPGHGGFLDRFDGFLVATPLMLFLKYLFYMGR